MKCQPKGYALAGGRLKDRLSRYLVASSPPFHWTEQLSSLLDEHLDWRSYTPLFAQVVEQLSDQVKIQLDRSLRGDKR